MSKPTSTQGQWTALTAAILGWLFDGFEMGLFPLVANPALKELLQTEDPGDISKWIGIMTAGFLVGAATGGVLFGWLGDRIGRVRAMALSILTYAIFSGLCSFAQSASGFLVLRFISSLGMGGEWALGVSLVMELWPSQSRGWLAGLIGAASNVGFILVGLLGVVLNESIDFLYSTLPTLGMSEKVVEMFLGNQSWRLLTLCGAIPALLTFLIRIFVPESEKWLEEQSKGSTRHWSTIDLLGVLIGALGPIGMIYLWIDERVPLAVRGIGTVVGLLIAFAGYTYPVKRYLERVRAEQVIVGAGGQSINKLMVLGALVSGVALLGTWASIQFAAVPWAAQLTENLPDTNGKEITQMALGVGAIIGTILAAIIGHRFGRRATYFALAVLSWVSVLIFYLTNHEFTTRFVICSFFAGGLTASFYGLLPLYLPELFPTRVRATAQGFAFNFGRILAAVGALQAGVLSKQLFDGSLPRAASVMSCIYIVGMIAIWFMPETRDRELPA
jgi:MFS family permease